MFDSEKEKSFLKKIDSERLSVLVKDLVETQIVLNQTPRRFEDLFLLKFEDGIFQVEQTDEAKKLSESPIIWDKYLRLQALMQCILIETQEESGGLLD